MQRKKYIEDLVFHIKHEQWGKFYKRVKRGKVLHNKIRILGDLNIRNFLDGEDSFYPRQAEDEIEEKTGNRPNFGNIVRDSNKLLQEYYPEESFFERTSGGYRLRFFVAKGPKKLLDRKSNKHVPTEPIYFYSHENEDLKEAYRDLKQKRLTEGEVSPIEIPRIQTFLKKDNPAYNEPNPFRSYGPMWVDFEDKKSYLVERDEVDDIIEKLNDKRTVIIKGDPASGKSVVLRNVGFRLVDSEDVYIINLKLKSEKEPPSISEVLKLKNCYLLIDDAHLNEDFVSDVLDSTEDIKILIAIRDVTQQLSKRYHGKLKERMVDAIELEARDGAEQIIDAFDRNRKEIKQEAIEELEDYKDSLWHLTWALETYERDETVDREKVLGRMGEWIKGDLETDYGIEKADNILYILSVFYRYEIKINRDFFGFLGYKINKEDEYPIEVFPEKDIKKLIKINEIVKDGRKLGLHHSDLADLYMEAIEHCNLAKDSRKNFDEVELLKLYIQRYEIDLEKAGEWFYNIKSHEKEAGLGLLRIIIEKIEAEEDIVAIGQCLYWLGCANYFFNSRRSGAPPESNVELKSRLIGILRKKMHEEDITNITWLVSFMLQGRLHNVVRELLDIVAKKIEDEDDYLSVWGCFFTINDASGPVRDIVKITDPNKAKTDEIKKYLIELKTQYSD